MGLGDGGGGKAQGGDAGAGARAVGQVTGDGEGFRRQGREAYLVAPVGEQFPLCAIDAPGVVGEDGLQGGGDALIGGAQGRQSSRLSGDDLQVAGGGGHRRVSGGISVAISAGRKLRDNDPIAIL